MQNWISCSSMIFCKTGFCVAQMWSSTALDWEHQSKIGFHATQNSFIWDKDHSGKLCFGIWSCVQQFAGEDKYVSSMKSTPAWTNSDSNIKCLFTANRDWRRDRQMIKWVIWRKVCFLNEMHCSLKDSSRNLKYPCAISCKLWMNEGLTDGLTGRDTTTTFPHSSYKVVLWRRDMYHRQG
jgi:hypothetical protein